MRTVVFVAPFFLPATLRFVKAIADLPKIRFGLISQDPVEDLPPEIAQRVETHYRISQCLNAGQLAIAAKEISKKMGGIDRFFGALEDLQLPIAKVRDHLGIEGLGVEAATNFRDKSRMKNLMRQHDLPCARHALVTDKAQAWAFVKETGYPLVVKPPDGAGARNTFQVSNPETLKDYLDVFAPSPTNPTLLEEFIQGDEYSFEGFSIQGHMVWHSLTRYYPNPLDVLKNPWIQWCVLLPREIDHSRFDDIRYYNRQVLQTLGMRTGVTHMEWFRRKDGSVAVSEVAARPPGAQIMSLMSYANSRDFYHAWAELMVHDRFEPPERKFAAGAAFLRGQGQGRVKRVHGLEQAQREVGDVVMEAKLPQPGQFSSSSYEGEGYVIVRHPDTEIVKRALQRLVSLIRVEYA